MLKTALAYVGNIIPGFRSGEEPKMLVSPLEEVRAKWVKLVESDFEEEQLHQFAVGTRAQELPNEVFAALLSAGEKNAVSYFFEYDPGKGDILNASKVLAILNTPGLRFASKQGGFEPIDCPVDRAIRVLTGCAEIESSAFAYLLLHRNCGLVMAALWPKEIVGNEVLAQSVAQVMGVRSYDLKAYSENPKEYVRFKDDSMTQIDLLVLRTIAEHPARVFDILSGTE